MVVAKKKKKAVNLGINKKLNSPGHCIVKQCSLN